MLVGRSSRLPTRLFVRSAAAVAGVGLLLVSGCVSAPSAASPAGPALRPVIESAELADALRAAPNRLVVLDVRDAAEYAAEHVTGAVRVDPTAWHRESLNRRSGIEDGAAWRARFGALGISGNQPVVLYDDGHMTDAARAWFLLQHFGVPEAAVVNGGYPAMAALFDTGDLPGSQQDTEPTPTEFAPPTRHDPAIDLVSRGQLRRELGRNGVQVLDVRTKGEFAGKVKRRNSRPGHLPSAINLPHAELLTGDHKLKSPGELAELFRRAGVKPDKPVVVHCQSGGRSSLAALALERAGYESVLNYYRSFGDWSADETCPVETGE